VFFYGAVFAVVGSVALLALVATTRKERGLSTRTRTSNAARPALAKAEGAGSF
jgi:outer membrane murein-binding lipoprotein Lpp